MRPKTTTVPGFMHRRWRLRCLRASSEKAARLATESRQLWRSSGTADGSMPLELERTNALSYSTYNLQAWYRLAAMAEKAGVDLWHYHNSRKAGLQTATQWLFDYAMGKKKFPYQQIDRYNNNVYREMLTEAETLFSTALRLCRRRALRAR